MLDIFKTPKKRWNFNDDTKAHIWGGDAEQDNIKP